MSKGCGRRLPQSLSFRIQHTIRFHPPQYLFKTVFSRYFCVEDTLYFIYILHFLFVHYLYFYYFAVKPIISNDNFMQIACFSPKPFHGKILLSGCLLYTSRLVGMDKSLVEAARDLGAGELRAFFDITLPLLAPAIASGMLLSFVMSFDDVIISVFVTGVNVNTLPIKIYTQLKTGVTPEINALCVLMLAVTVAGVVLSTLLGGRGKTQKEELE